MKKEPRFETARNYDADHEGSMVEELKGLLRNSIEQTTRLLNSLSDMGEPLSGYERKQLCTVVSLHISDCMDEARDMAIFGNPSDLDKTMENVYHWMEIRNTLN